MKFTYSLPIALLATLIVGPVLPAHAEIDPSILDSSAGSSLARHEIIRSSPSSARAAVRGMDVSYWQGPAESIDWQQAADRGAAFIYVKVSEGSYGGIATRYAAQRAAAARQGLFTGPYHFANPNKAYASGTEQARLFASYSTRWAAPVGAPWAPGQRMLPPMLDLEWNPYPEDGDECYDLDQDEMIAWIRDFVDEATSLFGRAPVIYTSTRWWSFCTGNSDQFADTTLSLAYWTADKAGGPGALPASWDTWTFWQHGNDDTLYTPKPDLLPGDQQYFNGADRLALEAFADSGPR